MNSPELKIVNTMTLLKWLNYSIFEHYEFVRIPVRKADDIKISQEFKLELRSEK